MKNKLYNILISNDIVIEEDVYIYGLNVLINYFIYFVLLLPIGIFFNLFVEICFFILTYMPLKRYIGGFHFDKNSVCIFFSIIFSIVIPYISKIVDVKLTLLHLLLFMSITLLITKKFKTRDHYNKPLTVADKIKYTNVSIKIECIYFFFIFLLYYMNQIVFLNIALLSIGFCVLGIVNPSNN